MKVSEWFRNNYLKANDTKSHVNGNITLINVEGNIEINEKTEKFLRITANNKLSFEHHLNKIYKKVSEKQHVLAEFQFIFCKRNLN